MTLRDLLLQVTEPDVLTAIGYAYPDDKIEPYRGMIGRLLEIAPQPSEMTIVIRYISGEYMGDPHESGYYDISGDDGSGTSWAIEYTPWDAWLAMGVRVEDVDLTPAQIVAHCLWEMTWAGFEPETIAERKDEIDGAAAELKAALATLPDNPTQADYESIGLSPFPKDDE